MNDHLRCVALLLVASWGCGEETKAPFFIDDNNRDDEDAATTEDDDPPEDDDDPPEDDDDPPEDDDDPPEVVEADFDAFDPRDVYLMGAHPDDRYQPVLADLSKPDEALAGFDSAPAVFTGGYSAVVIRPSDGALLYPLDGAVRVFRSDKRLTSVEPGPYPSSSSSDDGFIDHHAGCDQVRMLWVNPETSAVIHACNDGSGFDCEAGCSYFDDDDRAYDIPAELLLKQVGYGGHLLLHDPVTQAYFVQDASGARVEVSGLETPSLRAGIRATREGFYVSTYGSIVHLRRLYRIGHDGVAANLGELPDEPPGVLLFGSGRGCLLDASLHLICLADVPGASAPQGIVKLVPGEPTVTVIYSDADGFTQIDASLLVTGVGKCHCAQHSRALTALIIDRRA